MRIEIVALCLVFLFFSVLVFAYDEPDHFAGVKFGQDLTKQVPKCPYESHDGVKIKALKKRCYAVTWSGSYPHKNYQLFNMGEIESFVLYITASQVNDKMESVRLDFNNNIAADLLAILNQRYGKPTTQSSEPWRSQGGLKVTSLLAVWKGQRVSITFRERVSEARYGTIDYETAAWVEYLAQQRAKTLKKATKGL